MALLVLREDVLFNLSLFKEGSVLYPDKWEKTKEQTAALCANIMHDDSITTYELAIASACPLCSAPIPGYAPGVSINDIIGILNLFANFINLIHFL